MTGGGKFAFHFGVDIWGPNGTAVYPVVSGTVGRVSHEKHREYVEILTGNGRSFEYWHVRAAVRPGQRAEAGCHRARHDHGTVRARPLRGDPGRSGPVNPLAPGRLTPYTDTTRPRVESISLRRTETGSALLPSFVRGRVLHGRRGVRHAPALRSGRLAADAGGARARHAGS